MEKLILQYLIFIFERKHDHYIYYVIGTFLLEPAVNP